MTDSSEEKEKLEYVKKDLFQPISRPWQYRGHNGDDKSVGEDSNHLFMSEPSMSEADSSEHHLRLLSPMESLTDDQSLDDDGLPPPPPPPARLLTTQSPASPGNTSLSSWESPHLNRRIHLHFSPEPRDDRRYHTSMQRGFVHPSHHAVPQQSRTPDREFASDNQQSSASEVSSGQRRRANQFLHDLRKSSEGQVRESAVGANDSFDSSYMAPNHRDGIQNVLRKTAGGGLHQERTPSTETEVADNIGRTTEPAFSAASNDHHGNPTDDTIVMTLSASEDERDTTTNDSSHPLDWEQQHSADDEKTAELKPRIRTRAKVPAHRRSRSFGDGKQPGHRRQRSGDAAAATLSTGSANWKGMGPHKILLPPVPGEEDDEDDEHGNDDDRKQDRDKGASLNQNTNTKTTVDGNQDLRAPSSTAGDIAQFSTFALGADPTPAPANRRNSRRPRRDSRFRKQHWLELDSEESSSVASSDFSPRYVFQKPTSRHMRVASHPIPPIAPFQTSWAEAMSPYSQPSPKQGHYAPNAFNSYHFGGTYQPGDPQFSPRFNYARSSSERAFRSFDRGLASHGHHPAWFLDANTERPMESNDDAHGSPSSTFSWLSGKLGVGSQTRKTRADLESLPLLEKQSPRTETDHSDERDLSYDFQSDSESDDSSNDEARDHFQAHMKHDHNGQSMRVVRHHENPFENLGKQAFDRSRFSVQTNAIPADDKKFPTYICPTCNTRQREFFTVSSAPKTFESASGYIAFYFSIYVIAALYLFGLQEGWSKLDCIYFAVITLTTAGLGDFVPTTDGAKIICSVFIYFGVACIGLLLGSYIAGMLDETSSRTARANRIKSCPNCARIQNIKEAAERRHAEVPMRHSSTQSNHSHFSVRPNGADRSSDYEPDSKKVKRQHNNFQSSNIYSPVAQTTHAPDGRTFVVGPHHNAMRVDMSPSSSSGQNEASQHSTIRSPMLPGYSPRAGVSPLPTPPHPMPTSATPPHAANFMGSPMTTQILRRQSHSRHASFDLNGANQFAAAYQQQASLRNQRKMSADLPATIHEAGSQENHTPPPPPEGEWHPINEDDDGTYESETSSSNSEYSTNEEDEQKKYGMKNAKYVFVTLKEALLNSVVIITFGCMGFCFIEEFSIIDSWYFTTVLLTTVGYGDITPYTKGGKLFATVYILVAGTILLNNMSMISMIPLELRKRRTERAVLEQFGDWLDDAALRELATGPLVQRLNLSYQHPTGLDECTREMFSLAMLVRLGKVTEEDIKQTFGAFEKLDVHGEGVLNSRSIIAGMIQKHRNSSVNLQRLASVKPVGQRRPGVAPEPSAPMFTPTAWSAGGYGNWYSGGSAQGSTRSSYTFGSQRPSPAMAMSERSSIMNSTRANYGSDMSQAFQQQRERTGSA